MEVLSRNWGWLLALGILMIILGAIAIAAPVAATIAVQFMLGWLLVITGIAEGITPSWSAAGGGSCSSS